MELKETHCKDWTVKPISSIATIIGGGTPPTTNSAYWNGSIPWFTPTEIQDTCKYISKSKRTITEKALDNSGAKLLPVGTILLTTRASIGLRAILKVSAATNQGFQSLIVNSGIDNQFIYYLLGLLQPELIRNASGSTFLEISPKKLGEISLCIPCSLAEQKAIASALSDVDALLSSLDALIAKKRDMKTAAMQELLTGKTRLPDFSGKWKENTFKNIAPLQRGYDLPLNKVKKGLYPVVGSNGIIFYHKEFKMKGPGVITGRSGTIGSVFFIEEDYWPHNTTLYVINFYKNYPKYIYYLYSFCNIKQYSNGSGVPTLNRNDLHDIKILIPDYEEQAAIAAILSDMDAEIAALEARRAKVRDIKTGMMRELLTGKTRLVPTGERHG